MGPLKTCRDSGQIYPWLPRQNTESLLLWAYATDGDSRPFLWLGPKSAEDAQTMTLRHWLLNKEVPTFPLPGIYFFDAWRIRPGLEIPAKLTLGLTAVDLRHDEEMSPQPTAQDTSHGDLLLRRQEVLTARADAKTVAESAMEVSYVMQLSQALLEAGDTIQESTQARHRYLAVQKDHEEAKETQGESKRRATGTTRARAAAPATLPQAAAMSHEGSPELPRRVVDKVLGNLADAVAKRYRPWPKGLRTDSLPWFDSPLVQGASRLRYTDKAQMQRPGHTGRKALATKKDKVLGNLQHLPDAWPLMRFDLMLHKSSSFYAIWRRFLHLNEYLRNNLAPDTANATIDAHARGLTEHLVEFLAEWILMALEPARAITKTRAPDFFSCTRRTFGLNKSGWISTRRWC